MYLLRQFFHQMTQLGQDQLFHREPDGVFGAGGGEEHAAFDDAGGGAAHDGRRAAIQPSSEPKIEPD
jgi:hypothetical protein